MLVTFSGVVPRFVKVTFWGALVVPTAWLPKFRLVGDDETRVPIPVKLSTCGLVASPSEIVTVPYRIPFVVGVNLGEMVQLAPAARLFLQVVAFE